MSVVDDFLTCRNCRNWGQPWLLQRKTMICEKKLDVSGNAYTPGHPACKYFVPILNKIPENLQKIRLLVQTLNPTQLCFFAWSLSQVSLLLGIKDLNGKDLALGDYVSFRFGAMGHIGTVEGVDPYHKQAIIVSSPAFVNSSISLLASSLTKISKNEAAELIFDTNCDDKIDWQYKSLINEIALLKSRQDTWTKDDRKACALYEHQLENLELQKKQHLILTSI